MSGQALGAPCLADLPGGDGCWRRRAVEGTLARGRFVATALTRLAAFRVRPDLEEHRNRSPVLGEAPAELEACGAQCFERLPHYLLLDCDYQSWEIVPGRIWWGPLRCVGEIQISIQARPLGPPQRTIPLYVEIRVDPLAAECKSFAGTEIWETLGTFACDPDSQWVHSPPIDLPGINVPIGAEYYIQFVGFEELAPGGQTIAASPFIRCMQVYWSVDSRIGSARRNPLRAVRL